jgi:Insect cuticle protein
MQIIVSISFSNFFICLHLSQLIAITTLCAAIIVSARPTDHDDVGFSFSKFSGPVSGADEEIQVGDKEGHGHAIDYDAKPDYTYEYGVEDPKTHVSQNRKEERHGDETVGEYSVLQPDGKTLTVKYTVDPYHGFQAQVFIDGKLQ